MKRIQYLRFLLCSCLCVCVGFYSVSNAFADGGVYPNNGVVIPYDRDETSLITWGTSTIQFAAYGGDVDGDGMYDQLFKLNGDLKGDHYYTANPVTTGIEVLEFGKLDNMANCVLYPGLYDYYIFGFIMSDEYMGPESYSFVPDEISLIFADCDGVGADPSSNNILLREVFLEDLTICHMDAVPDSIGFTYSGKIPDSIQSSQIAFLHFYDNDGGNIRNNNDYCAYILAVNKMLVGGGSGGSSDFPDISSDLADLISSSESTTQAVEELTQQIEELTKTDEAEDSLGIGDKVEQVEELLGPIDVASGVADRITELFSDGNVSDASITFPSFDITVEGVSYTVWPSYVFDFAIIENYFPDLIFWVRRGLVTVFYVMVFNYVVQSFEYLITGLPVYGGPPTYGPPLPPEMRKKKK